MTKRQADSLLRADLWKCFEYFKGYGKDALLLTQTLVPMEKWKRDALTEILKDWMSLIESALVTASGVQAVSPMARALASARESRELYAMYETLKKAREYALSNVSPAAVCGYLCWELR